jgi:hypothetical protein
MKKLIASASAVGLALLQVGCVQVRYTKTVTTQMDGSGKVIGIVITEEISEPHSESPRVQSVPSGSLDLKNIQK